MDKTTIITGERNMTKSKVFEVGDKIFSEICQNLESHPDAIAVLTPSIIQALHGVSRNTADGVLERVRLLAEQGGLKVEKGKKGIIICRK